MNEREHASGLPRLLLCNPAKVELGHLSNMLKWKDDGEVCSSTARGVMLRKVFCFLWNTGP
jgi:hypothetical protein